MATQQIKCPSGGPWSKDHAQEGSRGRRAETFKKQISKTNKRRKQQQLICAACVCVFACRTLRQNNNSSRTTTAQQQRLGCSEDNCAVAAVRGKLKALAKQHRSKFWPRAELENCTANCKTAATNSSSSNSTRSHNSYKQLKLEQLQVVS